jgi:hypothetical protein
VSETLKLIEQAETASRSIEGIVKKELGMPIFIPDLPPLPASTTSRDVRERPEISLGAIWPVGANLDALSHRMGTGFVIRPFTGVTSKKELKPSELLPGIINSRTKSRILNFTSVRMTGYEDVVDLEDNTTNFVLSPLQKIILEGSFLLQDIRVGSESLYGSEIEDFVVAAEIGHVAMAVRSLSDPGVKAAIDRGKNPVVDWSKSDSGILPVFTAAKNGVPGALDLRNDSGDRRIQIISRPIRQNDADCTLIKPPAFDVLEIGNPEKEINSQVGLSARTMLGFALVAARQKLGKQTADTQLRKTLRQVDINARRIAQDLRR